MFSVSWVLRFVAWAGAMTPRAALLGVALAVFVASPLATLARASEVDDDVEVASVANDPDLGIVELFENVTKLTPRINLWQGFVIDSDFGKSETDTFISGLQATVGIPVREGVGIRLSNVVEAETFAFHDGSDLLYTGKTGGEPFDPLISHRMRIDGSYTPAPTWLLGGGAFVQSRVEYGATYASGITGGGGVVVGKELWGQLSIVLGVGVTSRLDQDTPGISPIVQLRWKVNDDTQIQSEGLGASVVHRVSPKLKLDLLARFEGHQYRLDRRKGPADPGDPTSGPVGKGSLRDRRFHIVTGATWAFGKRWRVRGAVGAVVYHQYTSADHEGKKVDSTTANGPAFGCVFEVRYRF